MHTKNVPKQPSNNLRVLVASTNPSSSPSTLQILQRLKRQSNSVTVTVLESNEEYDESLAVSLCDSADILVVAPIDARTLGKVLNGITDNLLLEVLRSWDVSKKVVLIPAMSTHMWDNPMTRKQLSKIRRKWNWFRVLSPILWDFQRGEKNIISEDGIEELFEVVQNEVDLMNMEQDLNLDVSSNSHQALSSAFPKKGRILPPELWTMILDFTGDWELAKTLNVYTNIPTPQEWRRPHETAQHYMQDLEWTLLTGNIEDVKRFIEGRPTPPRWLSRLCIKLIMRFAKISVLSYLETHHHDLFWATFGRTFLPDKASSVFGQPAILEYWRTSPSFLKQEYTVEAIDGASRAGFVHVLDWWHHSGLPLWYTEAALEQASSKGNIDVLEWWKKASRTDESSNSPKTDGTVASSDGSIQTITSPSGPSPLRLLPGKSISLAAQAGHLAVIKWWLDSGIPFPHEADVVRLASAHGHVDILDLWYHRKQHFQNMPIDNQVLVVATKAGHVEVLEWWATVARGQMRGSGGARPRGVRVEYKTCEIEEALEDGVEGDRGDQIRRWWARNGLNLGLGTSEWMKTKVLT
ncbi:MAG: hypothetical protein M1820_001412 [Bogoriella megaspora]|nr:MAG: hypothetical protein M1820_001412 [Bogoriella megaspora]